jgi:hypothetical protein
LNVSPAPDEGGKSDTVNLTGRASNPKGPPTAEVSIPERLDEEKIGILRSWGAGLSADDREEVRAAGKAIVLLIEEIERLHVDVWNARAGSLDGPAPADPQAPVEPEGAELEDDELERTLRSRLSTLVPRLRRG